MKLDSYVTLGRSGLKVSPLCLGAMTFGEEWGIGVGAAEANRIMSHYLDIGGNFIDTANIYNNGHSETIIGDYIAANSYNRDRLVIGTKFAGNTSAGDPNASGAGRKNIIASCEASLRRLRTDYIDLYWMHWPDSFAPIEETMECLNDLVRSGKVRYIGFSDTPAWRCVQAQMTALLRNWSPLTALQLEYSLIERTIEGELLPMAAEFGMGVVSWSPLAAGALSGKYTREAREASSAFRNASLASRLDDRGFDIIDRLKDIASDLGTNPARVALAWVMARSGITAPIIGARTFDQFEENLRAIELCLSPDQMASLNEISTPRLIFPISISGGFDRVSYGGMTINGRRF